MPTLVASPPLGLAESEVKIAATIRDESSSILDRWHPLSQQRLTGDKTMYFSGLHHDSSPYNGYDYYGERYTVSTVHCVNRWETCVFDVIDGGSEVVWIGVPSATPAEVKAEHDRWVKECRSGEFKFFEED